MVQAQGGGEDTPVRSPWQTAQDSFWSLSGSCKSWGHHTPRPPLGFLREVSLPFSQESQLLPSKVSLLAEKVHGDSLPCGEQQTLPSSPAQSSYSDHKRLWFLSKGNNFLPSSHPDLVPFSQEYTWVGVQSERTQQKIVTIEGAYAGIKNSSFKNQPLLKILVKWTFDATCGQNRRPTAHEDSRA